MTEVPSKSSGETLPRPAPRTRKWHRPISSPLAPWSFAKHCDRSWHQLSGWLARQLSRFGRLATAKTPGNGSRKRARRAGQKCRGRGFSPRSARPRALQMGPQLGTRGLGSFAKAAP